MIKNYMKFISENLAQEIESLAKSSDYARKVVAEFISDIDSDVRIYNAVSTLSPKTQQTILRMIHDENKEAEPVEALPITDINYNESQQIGGRNLFKCFLKIVSALGQKNCEVKWESVPNDYLVVYITDILDWENTSDIMSRYEFFEDISQSYQSENSSCKLFWGLKNDMNVQYGILMNKKIINLGSFLLTQGTYNFLMTLDLKSAQNFKKFLVSLDLKRLNILSKIKLAMVDYFPGQTDSKFKPNISNEIITYGYQGLGKWDNGILDSGEIENIKNNFRQFISQYKWSEDIQFSITNSNNWVFINLKLK